MEIAEPVKQQQNGFKNYQFCLEIKLPYNLVHPQNICNYIEQKQ